MKMFLKQIVATGFCFFLAVPFGGKAEENPNHWVVLKSAENTEGQGWSASTLYTDRAQHKSGVCALDYKITFKTAPTAHPFVFLVSRMSRELWTTDRAWHLKGSEDGHFMLKIDHQEHFFELDPENEHIFMTLIQDEQIDRLLDDLEKAQHAEIKLSARGIKKEVRLPVKNLSSVLAAFRQCLAAPEIAYGKKTTVTNDTNLPKVFKE